MFVLYAIPLGLLLGILVGGRLVGLSDLRFRWAPLALIGLLIQVVLFTPQVSEQVGDAGVLVYLTSNLIVLAAVLRNLGITGIHLVALGSGLNLLVIGANGGYMPAAADAYEEQGRVIQDGYSNTKVVHEPMFGFLGDVIVLPSWLPFTNVISIGDVLIMLGVAIAIAVAMRAGRTRRGESSGGAEIEPSLEAMPGR